VKVLFFLHPGANSRGILLDIIQGFAAAGHAKVVWDTTPAAAAITASPSKETAIRASVTSQLSKIFVDHRIDLSIGMWGNGPCMTISENVNGRLVTMFERLRSPHLMVWLDSPERAHMETIRKAFKSGFFKLPYLFSFINNSETAREMRQVYQFERVIPRHYGVNPEVFKPFPQEKRQYDLVFCGCDGSWDDAPAWVKSELERDEPDLPAGRRAVAESQRGHRLKLAEQFEPSLRAAADAMIERLTQMQLDNRQRPMLDRVSDLASAFGDVGNAARVMLNDPELYAAVVTQIRRIESYERAFVFCHLSKHFNCGLFGKADYRGMGCPVPSAGYVATEDQARHYNQGRLGLSVMRWEDEAGYHLKPFEITASGVACIAQNRPGTEHLFEDGREIVCFSKLSEARRKIRDLLDNPSKLAAIAEAGRARTLNDHTWANWANEMIWHIQQWQAGQTPARAAA
jgi:glycosyltransferase involved in cell wall biosynthesis